MKGWNMGRAFLIIWIVLCVQVFANSPCNGSQFEVLRKAADDQISNGRDFPICRVGDGGTEYLTIKTNDALGPEDCQYTMFINKYKIQRKRNYDSKKMPFVLSVRSPEQYKIAHMPTAINVFWRDVFKQENLKKLPKDRPIIVYSYNGHAGGQVTTFLNALGYNAANLKWGLSAWLLCPTSAPGFYQKKGDKIGPDEIVYGSCAGYKVEKRSNIPEKTYAFPKVNHTRAKDSCSIILAAADAVISALKENESDLSQPRDFLPVGEGTVKPKPVFYRLFDMDPDTTPFVLDVRDPDFYAKGHIPGAYNIAAKEVFKKENLSQLPTDRDIVVCGDYGSGMDAQVVAWLNALGYKAINLKWGIHSWAKDESVAPGRYWHGESVKKNVIKGTMAPGTLDDIY